MQLPDYQGQGIVNLMASLQDGLGGGESRYAPLARLTPEQVRNHRQVLLLIIDGLGLNYLRAHPEAACLHEHLLGGITSVFPPTTAAAIPTFLTGEAPQQHGLTGWHIYFRELASVLAVLPGRSRYGGRGLSESGIDARRLLTPRPFSERISVDSYTLSPAFIADSDFNRAYLGRAQSVAFRGLSELMQQCTELLRTPGSKYLYAYWPELDSLGHRFGIHSEEARAHLLELDRAFEQLLDSIRGNDTLVVACADHGQIDPREDHRIDLGNHPALEECLVLPLCGETRALYCYLRHGHTQDFDAYLQGELAEVADCFPSAALIESAWFGHGEPHPQLVNRIGDRVLVMKEDYVLKDWLPQEKRYEMVGTHGGLSQDELWVPLIVAES
jgi:hypothetical protein